MESHGLLLFLTSIFGFATGYFGPFSDIWKITNKFGKGGFEGEVTIPIIEPTSSWSVVLIFDRPIRNLKVFQAILTEEAENRTRFVVTNEVWNGDIDPGAELYFRMIGFAPKDIPKMKLIYKNKTYGDKPIPKVRPISKQALKRIINADMDYKRAIRLSLQFFKAQKSGLLPEDNRIPWKNDSGLYDGGLEGANLVGGFYVGGDFVKFNFPMAFAITQLVWGALEFGDGYESAGEMENLFKIVKWGTDYFMKCHVSEFEYYGMVGDPEIEQGEWHSSNNMNWKRPAFKISPRDAGSDLAGETAAALAAASIMFETIAPDYSEKLRKHAKELWHFAENYRGRYDLSIPKATKFYKSSGYRDELVWGAIWIYKATKERMYLHFAESNYGYLPLSTDPGLSYDNKLLGIQLLLSDLMSDYYTYMNPVLKFCDKPGGATAFTLQNGLVYKDVKEGPVMFAANSAFVCAIAARRSSVTPRSKEHLRFVKAQVNIMLGSKTKKGFMIGYADRNPKRPHHRDSSCPAPPDRCGWDFFHDSSQPNSNILKGALVGGPNRRGIYEDNRDNFQLNQPNILYNSALQGAAAALIMFDQGDMGSSGGGSGEGWEIDTFTSSSLSKLFRVRNDLFFDACLSNPCRNGGQCENTDEVKFVCRCEGNYFGDFCDLKLNPEIEWISTWPNGAQVHIHLPSFENRRGKLLFIRFPLRCPLILVEVWQICLIPEQSSLENRTVALQQFGWQSHQNFVGLKFEFSSRAFSQTCFESNDFRFKLETPEPSDAGNTEGYNAPECSKSLPEKEKTPSKAIPTKKPKLHAIKELSADEEEDHFVTSKVTVTDPTDIDLEREMEKGLPDDGVRVTVVQGLVPADGSLITWMSQWGSGGQGHVSLVEHKALSDGTQWIMKLLFPVDCELAKVEFWHACVIPDLSQPEMGLFAFHQVGWQVYQDQIGMTVQFSEVFQTAGCFDVKLYSFGFEDADRSYSADPDSCKKAFNSSDLKPGDGAMKKELITSIEESEEENNEQPEENEFEEEIIDKRKEVKGKKRRRKDKISPKKEKGGENKEEEQEEDEFDEEETVDKRKEVRAGKPRTKEKITDNSNQTNRNSTLIHKDKMGEDELNELRNQWLAGLDQPQSTVEVKKLRAKVVSPDAVQLSWKKVKKGTKEIQVSYEETNDEEPLVKLKVSTGLSPAHEASVKDVPARKNKMVIKKLRPGKTYYFTVKAKDGRYYGPASSITVTLAPSDIQDMRTTNPNDTSVLFRWEKPPGLQRIYRVTYFPKTPNSFPKSPYELGGEETESIVTGLNKNTDYIFVFVVKNYNVMSEGKYVFVKTGKLTCSDKVCPEHSECVQTDLEPMCMCDFGYKGDENGCEDVDECMEEGSCDKNAKCSNFVGSYGCSCNNGYSGDGITCFDIDECLIETDVCVGSICKNTVGSYECTCEKGYLYTGSSCEDLDECKMGRARCPTESVCKNAIGSYECDCGKGMKFVEDHCEDINECRMSIDNCSASEICFNTKRSFKCTCGRGMIETENGGCEDLNECILNTHKCNEHATCQNMRSGYRCNCKPGYSGSGRKCEDIDECRLDRLNECDENAACTNSAGSYHCTCNQGFSGDGRRCSTLL